MYPTLRVGVHHHILSIFPDNSSIDKPNCNAPRRASALHTRAWKKEKSTYYQLINGELFIVTLQNSCRYKTVRLWKQTAQGLYPHLITSLYPHVHSYFAVCKNSKNRVEKERLKMKSEKDERVFIAQNLPYPTYNLLLFALSRNQKQPRESGNKIIQLVLGS